MLRDQGAMTQQALATKLHMDRTNLVGLLNDLESDGLVARTRSAEDRRRHLVELTAAGARRLGDAETALESSEDVVLRGLDEQERETLYRLLQRATAGSDAGTAATG
jgi:DNA-binding MarR family transcriptional regulator